MRPAAEIEPWLNDDEMFQWLQDAPGRQAHRRRLAIWLTHTSQLHAHKVAEIVGVSTQAVWLWIGQYNAHGPDALERRGRGGYRWSLLTAKEEADMVRQVLLTGQDSDRLPVETLKRLVEAKLGRPVSLPYIYRVLARWRRVSSTAASERVQRVDRGSFKDHSQPWRRHS